MLPLASASAAASLSSSYTSTNSLEIPQSHYGTLGIEVGQALVKQCFPYKLRYDQINKHIVVLDSQNLSESELAKMIKMVSFGYYPSFDGSRDKDRNLLIKIKATPPQDSPGFSSMEQLLFCLKSESKHG
jgi:hypothetical protein